MASLPFGTFRLIIVSLALCTQIYLLWRIRQAIRSSRGSGRRTSLIVALAGVLIGVLFAANWHIMYTPIPWLDPPTLVQAILFYAPAVWSFGSILSALLLLIAQLIGGLGENDDSNLSPAGPPGGDRSPEPRPAPLSESRDGSLAASPFLLSGYGAAYAARNHMAVELTLPFGCPLRVVQLTDIHAGIFMTREMMKRYVDQVIALKPDLFVLTGDYISNSTAFFPGFVEEMARVQAPYGTFATMGNHEHWCGELSYYQGFFERQGIRLLQNTHQVIRTGQNAFAVAGIDDLRWGQPDLEAALRGLRPNLPVLLLSHRPEIFPDAAEHRIPLTPSGHYHGGQIKLSLLGADFSLAHLRTPYPEGLYRINASHLYVSRGIGTTFTPVRLNAPPEVTLFKLI